MPRPHRPNPLKKSASRSARYAARQKQETAAERKVRKREEAEARNELARYVEYWVYKLGEATAEARAAKLVASLQNSGIEARIGRRLSVGTTVFVDRGIHSEIILKGLEE